jgi:hypothetical protein
MTPLSWNLRMTLQFIMRKAVRFVAGLFCLLVAWPLACQCQSGYAGLPHEFVGLRGVEIL